MKRPLKKPPPKPRLLKPSPKKAPTPLLLAPMPLPLVRKPPLLAPTPPLLRLLLTPLLLRPPMPPLLRLKKRSKSQPFGAMTETSKEAVFLREGRLFLCPFFSRAKA